jgi:hypothetical protein
MRSAAGFAIVSACGLAAVAHEAQGSRGGALGYSGILPRPRRPADPLRLIAFWALWKGLESQCPSLPGA